MKKFSLKILVVLVTIIGISGCGTPSVPKVKISEKFQLNTVKLNVTQSVQPKITYHTKEEFSKMLNTKLTSLLKENDLLSTQKSMNTLVINAVYERKFVGDGTPFPTDSLAYPRYKYTIDVKNDAKSLVKVQKENLVYNGGFSLNLQVIAGSLRDKKYEIQFINALATRIFEDIKDLH